MRSATIIGWRLGSEITPVPKRMCRVRLATKAMKISGELTISNPAE
jgi:hypothetical protein